MEWIAEGLALSRLTPYRVAKDASIDPSFFGRVTRGAAQLGRANLIRVGEVMADQIYTEPADRSRWINQGLLAAGYAPIADSPAPMVPQLRRAEILARQLLAELDRLTPTRGNETTEDTLSRIGQVLRASIPYAGTSHAGAPEEIETATDTTLHDATGADYTVRIRGDSMIPYYNDGDLLLVRLIRTPTDVEFGKRYIVLIDNEPACKILAGWNSLSGDHTFAPANSVYPAIVAAAARVRIQGRVVGKLLLE